MEVRLDAADAREALKHALHRSKYSSILRQLDAPLEPTTLEDSASQSAWNMCEPATAKSNAIDEAKAKNNELSAITEFTIGNLIHLMQSAGVSVAADTFFGDVGLELSQAVAVRTARSAGAQRAQ